MAVRCASSPSSRAQAAAAHCERHHAEQDHDGDDQRRIHAEVFVDDAAEQR